MARQNFVLDLDADPGFAGTLDDTVVDGGLGGLRLRKTAAVDTIADIQDGTDIMVQAAAPLVMQHQTGKVLARGTWDWLPTLISGQNSACAFARSSMSAR